MTNSMRHEAFYESGATSVPSLGIYGGWTAHPDSAAARQSSSQTHAHISVLLAGECLSDERRVCLAAMYERHGEAMISELNGLFSGLIVDRAEGRALLFNDRYGTERIYFHEAPDAIYFASEAKALLSVVPETRAFDEEGLAQFLAFGYTVSWRTLFRRIDLLEGGSIWSFGNGTSRRRRYFSPVAWESKPALSEKAFEEEFEHTFRRALPRYLGSGTAVGLSLTGGLDTRMIVACLPGLAGVPVTYTFAGQVDRTVDERLAGRVAAVRGLPHHVLRLEPDFLHDYARLVDRTVQITDGCFGATGAHEVYLNAKARQLAPIRLTGNFGSEVLRSMSTFKPVRLSRKVVDAGFAERVASAEVEAMRRSVHPVTFAAFNEIPWSLFGSLAAGRSQTTFRTPYLDNDVVALAYQAPEAARQSPRAALRLIRKNSAELSRIPTDRGLRATANGIGSIVERLTAAATFKLDYLYDEGLPHWLMPAESIFSGLSRIGLLGGHKYLPFRRWFRHELGPHVSAVLTDPKMSRLEVLNAPALPAIARDHVMGRGNYVREINAALTLESIDRLLLRGWSSSVS
jgi:asparagine synthase (glutamine-hydrolysing)